MEEGVETWAASVGKSLGRLVFWPQLASGIQASSHTKFLTVREGYPGKEILNILALTLYLNSALICLAYWDSNYWGSFMLSKKGGFDH